MMYLVALGQGFFLQVFKFPPLPIVVPRFAFMHLQKLQYKGLVSHYPQNKKDRFKQADVSM